jgi:hypothetical protein
MLVCYKEEEKKSPRAVSHAPFVRIKAMLNAEGMPEYNLFKAFLQVRLLYALSARGRLLLLPLEPT